jgi:hypothetical protein
LLLLLLPQRTTMTRNAIGLPGPRRRRRRYCYRWAVSCGLSSAHSSSRRSNIRFVCMLLAKGMRRRRRGGRVIRPATGQKVTVSYLVAVFALKAGLWIRIDLIRVRIQAKTELSKTIFFSNLFEIKI